MTILSQASRALGVTTPLGDDAVVLKRMSGREQLGTLYEYQLDLLSTDHDLDAVDLLGQRACVWVTDGAGERRHFHGVIQWFEYRGTEGADLAAYRAMLVPWFWILTRTSDCRIFQNLTIPEIIKQVFRDNGQSDFEERLSGEYKPLEYCVQYRESDFDFLSRLMEEVGIYYFFEHEQSKHTLVIADSPSAHLPLTGHVEIPYRPASEARQGEEFIDSWRARRQVRSGGCASRDFDFQSPRKRLESVLTQESEYAEGTHEVFEYPGGYCETSGGDRQMRVRLEEEQAQHERCAGHTNVRALATGATFSLIDFPRRDQEREYLVVATSHELASDDFTDHSYSGGMVYDCSFEVIDAARPYRSPRRSPRPVIQGPQTAIVVGPAGEEIWTDEFGRVMVQFHWDRVGQSDESSSCWIRVAQLWAGKGWGALHLPRIGQEVIVEFLEGDPDRPIITGRVYNGESMPPYELPAQKTRSGVRTRSTKDGTAEQGNEIRFEDKRGAEELLVHAERDHTVEVENDQSITVGNDRSETIGNDRTLSVGHNKSESVKKNKNVSVKENHAESVGGNMTISVGENRTVTVSKNLTESVEGKMTLSVAKDRTTEIQGQLNVTVAKDVKINVDQGQQHTVAKSYQLKAKTIGLEAVDEIVIKCGKAKIRLEKNGDITISGKKITAKGSGDVILKGSKVKAN